MMTQEIYEHFINNKLIQRMIADYGSAVKIIPHNCYKTSKKTNWQQTYYTMSLAEQIEELKDKDVVGYGFAFVGEVDACWVDIDTNSEASVVEALIFDGGMEEWAAKAQANEWLDSPAILSASEEKVGDVRRKLPATLSADLRKLTQGTGDLALYDLSGKKVVEMFHTKELDHIQRQVMVYGRNPKNGLTTENINEEKTYATIQPQLLPKIQAGTTPRISKKKIEPTPTTGKESKESVFESKELVISKLDWLSCEDAFREGAFDEHSDWIKNWILPLKANFGLNSQEAIDIALMYSENSEKHDETQTIKELTNNTEAREVSLGSLYSHLIAWNTQHNTKLSAEETHLRREVWVGFFAERYIYVEDYKLSRKASNQLIEQPKVSAACQHEILKKLFKIGDTVYFVDKLGAKRELIESYRSKFDVINIMKNGSALKLPTFSNERFMMTDKQQRERERLSKTKNGYSNDTIFDFKGFNGLPEYTPVKGRLEVAIDWMNKFAKTITKNGFCIDSSTGEAVIHRGKKLSQLDWMLYAVLDRRLNPSRNPNRVIQFINSAEGIGKGTFAELAQILLGAEFCYGNMNSEKLFDSWSKSVMFDKLFLHVPEFQGDKDKTAAFIRELVDGTQIERKMRTQQVTEIYTLYLLVLSSNTIVSESRNGRRVFTPNCLTEYNTEFPNKVALESYTKQLWLELQEKPWIALEYFYYLAEEPYDITQPVPLTEMNGVLANKVSSPTEKTLRVFIQAVGGDDGYNGEATVDVSKKWLTAAYDSFLNQKDSTHYVEITTHLQQHFSDFIGFNDSDSKKAKNKYLKSLQSYVESEDKNSVVELTSERGRYYTVKILALYNALRSSRKMDPITKLENYIKQTGGIES